MEAAFRDREERRRARERKRRRDIFRRIQKETQKLLFIFGRPDSDQTQEKLAKSMQSDEDLYEADSNESRYKKSGPHDGRSDGQENSG